VNWYLKSKTNLDFTDATDTEWQWHQVGRVQVRTSIQTDNHASTPPLSFSQARCPSCRPTHSVKALKARKRPGNGRFSGKTTFFITCKIAVKIIFAAENQGPGLQNILRQSYDYLTIMRKLRST